MFYLQPGIHFQKIKILICPDNKFHCPGRDIIHRFCQLDRLLAHRFAGGFADKAGRGFLDNFLMAALYRTFPLAQIDNMAMGIAQNLNFNMARRDNKFFNKHPVITKGIGCFSHGSAHRLWQFCLALHHAHTLAPAASRGLNHHRIANPSRCLHRCCDIADRPVCTRHARDASRLRQSLGFNFIAHYRDSAHIRANKTKPCLFDRLDKAGIFRQKTIAGMDSLCPAIQRGLNNHIAQQIAFL